MRYSSKKDKIAFVLNDKSKAYLDELCALTGHPSHEMTIIFAVALLHAVVLSEPGSVFTRESVLEDMRPIFD
jgi:hypothetical protein